MPIAEARFRAAVQAVDGVVWTNDAQGAMQDEQPGWAALTGQTRDEYQTFGWAAAVHPDDAAPTLKAWREAVADRKPFVFEHRIRRHDGQWRHFTVRAIPLLSEAGVILEWVGVHIDITARKQTDEALRASEARLKAIFEAVPVGIIIGEAPSGRIIAGNRQAEAMLGHPVILSPDVAGYSAWVSHHADGRVVQPQDYPLARAIGGEERPELEAHYRRSDGRQAWVRFIAAPIRAADGTITGGIVASLDIDRETRALQALDRTREELEARVEAAVRDREAAQARLAHAQRMEALGQLAGGIAHDFNNVLQAVSGGLRLIERRAKDSDEIRTLARMALDAAERGASVTARLLTFARQSELRAEPVAASALLDDMREILAATLGAAIAVRIETQSATPALWTDRAQLETALVNLAINARDAMPAGGTLTLAARAETVDDHAGHPAGLAPGDYVRLDVADAGTGMDAATLARAAEPFFTTKGPGQGTGLGLAMARGLAQQSGGGLAIASTLGRGTTVTLWFAEAKSGVRRLDPPDAPEPARPSPPARVLVVDDDPMVREMLAHELQDLGYHTTQASDGLAALAYLDRGETVDLLVTDLSMPGMNGALLTYEARQRRASLPVLLLTGYADETLDLDCLTEDGVVLLHKPLAGAELARHAALLLHPAVPPIAT
jgi:PAS domain S-box-containing protein